MSVESKQSPECGRAVRRPTTFIRMTAERFGRRLLTPPSPVYISGKGKISHFIQSLREEMGQNTAIADIGSGPIRREGVKGFDIPSDLWREPKAHVLYDGRDWPIRSESLGGWLSIGVMEHVDDLEQFASEANRVLKTGGRCLVTVPFMEGYHGSPNDYQRFTLPGLVDFMGKHGFSEVNSGVEGGPSSALAWMLRDWIACFARGKYSHKALFLAASYLVQPLKYFDVILTKPNNPHVHKSAAGLFYIGRKVCDLTKARHEKPSVDGYI